MGLLSGITRAVGSILGSSSGSVSSGVSTNGSSALGGWTGIATGLAQDAINFGLTERQNSMNRKHDWSMWNAQNEYNKPINQMARFKEAGLNPNLIYGQTNTAASVHSTPGEASKINAMTDAYNLRQQDAMTQQIRANTYNTLQQARMMPLNRDYLEAQIRYMNAQAIALENANKHDVDTGTTKNSGFVERNIKQAAAIVKEYGKDLGEVVKKIGNHTINVKGDGVFDIIDDIISGRPLLKGKPKNKSKRTVKLY